MLLVPVGGVPAGLEAARVSTIRGHEVTLFEAKDQLGGSLVVGGVPDFKEDDRALIVWYANQMDLLAVDVKMNSKATKEIIDEIKLGTLFGAEGSLPIVPKLEGIDKAVLAQDILLGKVPALGNVAIVGGGLVGAELALPLARQGKKVTIIEELDDILSTRISLPPMNEWMLRDLLAFNNINILNNSRLKAVTASGAVIEKESGEETLTCDQVVLAIGYRSTHQLYDQLKNDYTQMYNLGDSRQVRNIRAAIWDVYEVARSM